MRQHGTFSAGARLRRLWVVSPFRCLPGAHPLHVFHPPREFTRPPALPYNRDQSDLYVCMYALSLPC